jgi:heat shock protein HslJ
MKKLFMALLALTLSALLAACAIPWANRVTVPAPAQPALLVEATVVGFEWIAFAVGGVAEVRPPKPTLRWTSSSQVVGTGGCNRFSGASSVHLASLRFGPLSPVGKACATLPGDQEDKFFSALEQTRSARLEGHQLVLLDKSEAPLVRLIRSD